jgi:biopolymer transport protein ExbB
MFAHIAQFFRDGGFFMYLNIGTSIASLAIIIERVYRLYFDYNIHGRSFLEQAEKLILANNLDRAIKLCNSVPNALLPRVVKAGLLAAHKGRAAVSAALEESLLETTPYIQKRVQTLWSLANVATLLGLIGTIVGLIQAFGAIGLAAPEQKSILLTKGISEAMNNTAFGLGIAVTCIIAHLFINGQAKRMVEDMDLAAVRMENLLSSRSFTLSEEEEASSSARS